MVAFIWFLINSDGKKFSDVAMIQQDLASAKDEFAQQKDGTVFNNLTESTRMLTKIS